MRKLLFVASLLALGLMAGVAPGPSTAASTVTFGVPRVVDPIHTYGEPNIKVAPNGDVHVSGPQGTGVQRSIWNVSVDGGDSWRLVQAIPFADSSPLVPNKVDLGPGGGDTEIAITRSGRVFFNDLWALTCFTAAVTDDRGKTIQSQPAGCSHPPADREWMGILDPAPEDASTAPYYLAHKNDPGGYQPLNYDVYDDFQGDQADMTTDGLVYMNAGHYADDAGHSLVNGNVVVDQKTGALIGLVGQSGSDNTHFGLAVALGTPAADGTQTFTYKTISNTLPGDPQTLFPVLAQDKARNLYVTWATDCGNTNAAIPDPCFRIYYSYASAADGWTTWSAPKRIDTAPVQSSVMPWIAAGADGIVDIVWYGTDFTDKGRRIHPSEQRNQSWDVYMAQITNADTASPAIAQTKVTPHPMHYNDICLLGTGCITQVGDRNLADFFQVTIDNDGRARIVYADTSNGLIQPNFPEQIDHSGAALVTVATQDTGINAWTGQPLTTEEKAAPLDGVTDPVGDALMKPLGGATKLPGLDMKNVALSLVGDTLHVKITTEGDSIGDAAKAANALFGQLLVRWQMGDKLYYAGVQQSAAGGALTWYAGPSGTVDLCSVSACDPHYITYPAPPAGGTAVTGTTAATHSTVYDIAVPAAAVGGLKSDSLLEEVMGFSTVSATPAELPLTNPQADADIVPLQVEGTRTFNYTAASTGTFTPAPSPGGGTTAGSAGGGSAQLPATGADATWWLSGGGLLLALALVTRTRPRRPLRTR
ncbi:MAG: hypothetical protein QOK43_2286 [Acidimicrobiaceae bacterium]|nr:hypothetical protein [Acidimicrobiaceae bacterium]